jgi:ketosteroid isomerase-like protein
MNDDEQTRRIVRAHLEAWKRGDVPSLMADYAEDAMLLNKQTGPLIGKAAIAAMYQYVFTELFKPAEIVFTAEPEIVSGNYALVHWGVTTPTLRTSGGFDSFVLGDGLIIAQSAGVEIIPLG